jgi:hypothetical protein
VLVRVVPAKTLGETVPVISKVAASPFERVPMFQVSGKYKPWVEDAETKVTPAGKTSVKVTLVAVAGQLLETTNV